MRRIAIVSAMAEELRGLREHLDEAHCVIRAGREFWLGRLGASDAVLVLSRIGKVAAATTATLLLSEFDVDRIVFTGVAGGLGDGVRVGDMVVADTLAQHDMDASPIFPRHEVPLYGLVRFPAEAALSASLREAARAVVNRLAEQESSGPDGPDGPDGTARRGDPHRSHATALHPVHLADFGLADPAVHGGLILSGDRFVSSAHECRALREAFPDALAVEMEGAAVAQVCHDFGVPFAVLRTISDRADDDAHVDFNRFITDIASRYTVAVVMALLAPAAL